jgi:hypothetical protein
MRFNAYNNMFGMKKKDAETLEDFANRVTNTMQKVKDIQPPACTIDDLAQELEVMVLRERLG